jgi:hypothetical protein
VRVFISLHAAAHKQEFISPSQQMSNYHQPAINNTCCGEIKMSEASAVRRDELRWSEGNICSYHIAQSPSHSAGAHEMRIQISSNKYHTHTHTQMIDGRRSALLYVSFYCYYPFSPHNGHHYVRVAAPNRHDFL